MTQVNNTTVNEYSFASLFKKSEDNEALVKTIEIPSIQRDYAQGRNNSDIQTIRKGFLGKLRETLENETPIKLDFVYGSIDKGKFIPLDGQQRLTTLFLLYWYAAKSAKVEDAASDFLHKFTYQIRPSSSDFCRFLSKIDIDFSKVKDVRAYIEDQYAFAHSWKDDPTIDSMLRMIQEIVANFSTINNLWEKLMRDSEPLISFYFLELKNIGQTDNLYIKMNARGKPLTKFENFKNHLDAIIENVDAQVNLGLHQRFVESVDTIWSDVLWQLRQSDDELIDDAFMNIYRYATSTICFRLGLEEEGGDEYELAEKVYGVKKYAPEQAAEHIMQLMEYFDMWVDESPDGSTKYPIDTNEFFQTYLTPKRDDTCERIYLFARSKQINLLEVCAHDSSSKSFPYTVQLLFHGLFTFRAYNKKNPETPISDIDFKERMRMLRNLVENSEYDIRRENMRELIKETDILIETGVVSEDTQGFSGPQKTQEKLKQFQRAAFLSEGKEESVLLMNQLEDSTYFHGNIGIMSCETEGFEERARKFLKIFTGKNDNLLRISRAMFSFGFYPQKKNGRNHYYFGNHEEKNWRDLVLTDSKARSGFTGTQQVLFALMEAVDIEQDLKKELRRLRDEYINHCVENETFPLEYYFVKYKMLGGTNGEFEYSMIDDTDIVGAVWMMNKSQFNGQHWDYCQYHIDDNSKLISLEDNYGGKLKFLVDSDLILAKLEDTSWTLLDNHDNDKIDTSSLALELWGNSAYICDTNRVYMYELPIPQVEIGGKSVDKVDRVQLLVDFCESLKS